MKLYDLQVKAGPLPRKFTCSQNKCIHFLYLSIKMYSQPNVSTNVYSVCVLKCTQLQVFILVVSIFRSSAWDTPGVSFRDVKHCAHLGISYVNTQEQSCSSEFNGRIWKDWPWSLVFNLRTHALFLDMKTRPILNRLRLRIKGTSTRVLFRESARWKTLAALPRKVLCSLSWSITPHLPRTVLRLLIPLSCWKHSSCAEVLLPSICQ